MSNEQTFFDIPVPKNLDGITAIHDGKTWFLRIEPGSVEVDNGILTFITTWHGKRTRVTLALDIVAGYQTNE